MWFSEFFKLSVSLPSYELIEDRGHVSVVFFFFSLSPILSPHLGHSWEQNQINDWFKDTLNERLYWKVIEVL